MSQNHQGFGCSAEPYLEPVYQKFALVSLQGAPAECECTLKCRIGAESRHPTIADVLGLDVLEVALTMTAVFLIYLIKFYFSGSHPAGLLPLLVRHPSI